MDKFSLIVPFCDADNFIDSFISMVFPLKSVEIIFIENGENKSKYAENKIKSMKLSNVKYFYLREKGVSNARNYGLSVSTREYIFFADIDDSFDLNLFNYCEHIFDSTNCEIIGFGYNRKRKNGSKEFLRKSLDIVDENSRILLFKSIFGIGKDDIYNYYKTGKIDQHKNFSSVWSYSYRRKFLLLNDIKFSNDLKLYEDGMFNCECIMKSKKIVMCDKIFYFYNQMSNDNLNVKLNFSDLLKNKIALYNYREIIKNELLNKCKFDVSEFYFGSLIFSCMQLFLLSKNFVQLKEAISYAKLPLVIKAFKMTKSGGKIYFRLPFVLLKSRLFLVCWVLLKFGSLFIKNKKWGF